MMEELLAGGLDRYGLVARELAVDWARGLGESAMTAVFGVRCIDVGFGLTGGGSAVDQVSDGNVVYHGPDGNLPHQGLGGSAVVSVLLGIRSRQAEFQGAPPGPVLGAFGWKRQVQSRVCRRAWGGGQGGWRRSQPLRRGWRRRVSSQGDLWDPGGPRNLARPVHLQKFD